MTFSAEVVYMWSGVGEACEMSVIQEKQVPE